MWVLGWILSPLLLDNILRIVDSSSQQNEGQDLTHSLFGSFLSSSLTPQSSNSNANSTMSSSGSSDSKKRKENPSVKQEWQPTSKGFSPRYRGPPDHEMTAEQTSIRDDILASRPGTGLNGPFGPWLAVPAIAQPAQTLGKACRYDTSLSRRESELVILLTGAKFRSDTEFDIHVGEATKAGIDLSVIQAIPRDDDFSTDAVAATLVPLLPDQRERSIVQFTAELLETSKVSDETYTKTKEALEGKDSVLVEITSIVGYYAFVSYTLNVFRIPS
eukprot:scaffold2219_cov177-Amphora_coffeaeformis.AAC.15